MKVSTLLRQHGIDAHVPSGSEERDVRKLHVFRETQRKETQVNCTYGQLLDDVELKLPVSYAFDEAFTMIKVVISLVTGNFRCRVNSSCGIHVHLGNGPYRCIDKQPRTMPRFSGLPSPSFLSCKCRRSGRFIRSRGRSKDPGMGREGMLVD